MNINDPSVLAAALPEGVTLMLHAGRIAEAGALMEEMLKNPRLPEVTRQRIAWEKLRLSFRENDFNDTYDDTLAYFQSRVADFKEEELRAMMTDGRIEWGLRDGHVVFQEDAYAAVMINSPDLWPRLTDEEERARRLPPPDKTGAPVRSVCDEMREEGSAARRIRIRHTLRIPDEAVREGETLTVHLPFPQENDMQSEVVLHAADVTAGGAAVPFESETAPSDAAQRTVRFRAKAAKGIAFTLEYSYLSRAAYRAPDPALVSPEQPDFDTGEQYPHIVFTPFLKALAAEIADGESNPLLRARRFYDWITTRVRYSYTRSYLLFDNIPEFCALNLRGDCGVQALLFITLCRLTGIPAVWQSGMCAGPDDAGSHDWCKFYVAPFGWLYCDPSYGGGAFRRGDEQRRLHYFCNLDPYRMTANSAFMVPLSPEKKHLRLDPTDNQSGEAEYDDAPLLAGQRISRRELLACGKV